MCASTWRTFVGCIRRRSVRLRLRLTSAIDPYEPPFECGNGRDNIVAARCERPGKHRVLWFGALEYLGLFLFGGNVNVKYMDDVVEVGDQFTNLQCFPRSGCFLKMTLVFHLRVPNDLFRDMFRIAALALLKHRKKLANLAQGTRDCSSSGRGRGEG